MWLSHETEGHTDAAYSTGDLENMTLCERSPPPKTLCRVVVVLQNVQNGQRRERVDCWQRLAREAGGGWPRLAGASVQGC